MQDKIIYVPVSVEDELPDYSEDILISYDGGLTFPESAAYRETRKCMLAGVGGGNGYFGKGFCTNGSTGCDNGLILSDVTHWLKPVSLYSLLQSAFSQIAHIEITKESFEWWMKNNKV